METKNLYSLFISSNGVSIDTRNLVSGQIFFSLKGENFNGNNFALEALEKGASYSVIDDKSILNKNKNLIYVDDSLKSLQELSSYHRSQFDTKIIGVTGSNGKTTTKNLIYSILSQKYNVIKTKGNLNNHIGVPLSLFDINEEVDIAKACTVNVEKDLDIRIGKFGPYVQKDGNNTTIPEDLFFGELNKKKLDDLDSMQKEDNVIGVHTNGENILLKIGRYGPYVELEESKKRKSVLKSIGVENVTQDIAIELLSLPKKLGTHPEINEDVLADFGPYGPYVKCGKINASMKSDESPLTITLENAVKLIKDRKLKFEPKVLGEHPKTKNEISIKRGRFGPYVSDGKKNVSLKGYVVDEVTLDQAVQLIDEKS